MLGSDSLQRRRLPALPQVASILMLILSVLFMGSKAQAQSSDAGHALAGNWDVHQDSPTLSTSYAVITWNNSLKNYSYTTYTEPGGTQIDSGTIVVAPTGGWSFASSQGGGAGFIQNQSGSTYAWQNTTTGAYGWMAPH